VCDATVVDFLTIAGNQKIKSIPFGMLFIFHALAFTIYELIKACQPEPVEGDCHRTVYINQFRQAQPDNLIIFSNIYCLKAKV
jgi:hypothetical protein